MGWLIAFGIIVALAVLPLGASVKYDAEGPVVWVIAGPARIKVFPQKKTRKKEKPKKEKAKKDKSEEPEQAPEPAAQKEKPAAKPAAAEEKRGGSWKDFLPLVQLALDLLGDLRRKLRVDRLTLHMTMAADDPCDLAVNYGRANAAMAGLLSQLDRLFVIRKQDVRISCDFAADQTLILARLDLTITLGRLLALALRYGIRGLKIYQTIRANAD